MGLLLMSPLHCPVPEAATAPMHDGAPARTGRFAAWTPLARHERLQRLGLGLALPLAMAATPLWLQQGVGIGCGFRALTGWPCPLCGGTHACAALVQGDWAGAWAFNPGAVGLLLWLLVLAAQALAEGGVGRRRPRRWPWAHPAVAGAVGGGLLLSWAARLAGAV